MIQGAKELLKQTSLYMKRGDKMSRLKLGGSKDLTTGNPMKLILNFGVPLLFGMLFQQFYNMVDSIIVGKQLGVDALAAVGSTGSINFMVLGFCIGICNGFAIPIAQAFGAKDTNRLKSYIATAYGVHFCLQ